MNPTKPPICEARPEADRIDMLASRLKRDFRVDPAAISVARAPLRICPLGAHIDHQLGVVTGMTIDRSILMAFAPTDDGAIHIESTNFKPPVDFGLDNVPPYRPHDWGNYIRGTVLALQQSYRLERGLIGFIDSDMPIGGLSSSAAVTITYLLALEAIHALAVPPETNISLVRFAENQYIGLNNGILDQSVILFSKKDHLTLIDCQAIQFDTLPTALQENEFEILVVYSGVTHALVGTDYNNRVAECQEAARLLLDRAGKEAGPNPCLRQVEPELFRLEGRQLDDALKKRATHYFGEMERVDKGTAAWRTGDLNRFGALMSESGESSIKYYECGSPQLITLYETLRETPGVYGTRFSGAGFRGNCIAFIDPSSRAMIAEAVHRRYPAAHRAEADDYSIHVCRPGDQANVRSWRRG